MGGWFSERILQEGRLPIFCFFVAFLATFLFIRFSVRMIRAEVSWWPGNVTPGGMHIHHVVFGVVFMVVGGLAGLAVPEHPIGLRAGCAALFGLGTALVLDEFALILHLEDVYWSEAGRLSVDTAFIAAGIAGLLVIVVVPSFAGDVRDAAQLHNGVAAAIALAITLTFDFGLVAITVLKGKIWTGLFGLFLPILVIVGALRIGRPASPWARRFYRNKPKKQAKSRRRETRIRRRFVSVKEGMQDLVAGRPDQIDVRVPEPAQIDLTDNAGAQRPETPPH